VTRIVHLACIPLALLALHCNAETLTFESLPNTYFFSSGGQNIGTYFTGVDFEPNVTALSVSRFGGYDNAAFPPHSGDVVIWDPYDDSMTVSFADSQSDVGFWYTSLNPITLTALGSGGNSLGAAAGGANTDGTAGTSDFLSISEIGISSVKISGIAGQYVIGDLDFTGGTVAATPEPAALPASTAGGLLTLLSLISRTEFAKKFRPLHPNCRRS